MNVKEFFVKNKATIISVLSALLSLAVGLSGIDLGMKVGIIVAILVVVLPVFINLLTEGFNDKTVDLIVNAVSIIQQIIINANSAPLKAAEFPEDGTISEINKDNESEVTEDEVVIDESNIDIFTKEEIREFLLKGL